jgi:hypothetical protein
MSDTDAVLFANEAFYRAFADRDEEAMEDLWSATAQVACLHPGWGPLFGRDDVMESWIAIIRNPVSPPTSRPLQPVTIKQSAPAVMQTAGAN